ncbi:MAG TPA: TonB-dependent receptor [Thermoanaerobaculia bacterium]|jgi:outer membrane cobalamin receptor
MKRFMLLLLFALPLQAAHFAGRPLGDALRELESRGLRLIYSADVVTPAMIVRAEPRASEPRRILDELLREHALHAQRGPRGTLVIVRDAPKAPPKETAAPPPQMPVALAEIVVTPSRFTLLADAPESRQFLSRTDVQRVPHLADDLYRAIARVPGTTSADVSARFNLRGGVEDEVLVLVDGAEIRDPFHMRDLYRAFSTLDAEAVASADILSGGYPAEYGGRMSGVVDVQTLAPERTHHELGISVLNTRLLSEGAFGDGGAWLLSVRRGYLREVLALLQGNADVDPRYYDLLGKVQWALGDKAMLSAHALVAHDRLTLRDTPDTAAKATYDDRYVWLNLRGAPSPRLFAQSVLSYGTSDSRRGGHFDETIGTERGAAVDTHDARIVTWKNDATLTLSPSQELKFGVSAGTSRARYDYAGTNAIAFSLFNLGQPSRTVERVVHAEPSGSQFGAYVAERVRLTDTLVAEGGLRADAESYTPDGVNVAPRLNLAWMPSPRTSLRAAWGVFFQPQRIDELPVSDGATSFERAQRSTHRVVGVEQLLGRGYVARLELYDKSMSRLRTRYENLYDPLLLFAELRADRVSITPERARARGAELLLRSDPAARVSGWISYTFARATDTINGADVPRAWDQRHASTFSVNYRAGARWNANLAGTYHSGWPTTPVSARFENGRVFSEPATLRSARLPDYRRLDFRISRTGRTFDVFVELFNVLSVSNVTRIEGFDYERSGDAIVARPLTESILGILPSFGVTWKF